MVGGQHQVGRQRDARGGRSAASLDTTVQAPAACTASASWFEEIVRSDIPQLYERAAARHPPRR